MVLVKKEQPNLLQILPNPLIFQTIAYKSLGKFESLFLHKISELFFRANGPSLCGNCAFPQNFHTIKLGKITVFYAVYINAFVIV